MAQSIPTSRFDQLNQIVARVAEDELLALRKLNTRERLYVVLAAGRADLLHEDGYSVAEALTYLDNEWIQALIRCRRLRSGVSLHTA